MDEIRKLKNEIMSKIYEHRQKPGYKSVRIQPERSKREDRQEVIIGSKECIAIDAIPSQECIDYHKNSCIQIDHDGHSYLMRCSELYGNIERDK